MSPESGTRLGCAPCFADALPPTPWTPRRERFAGSYSNPDFEVGIRTWSVGRASADVRRAKLDHPQLRVEVATRARDDSLPVGVSSGSAPPAPPELSSAATGIPAVEDHPWVRGAPADAVLDDLLLPE